MRKRTSDYSSDADNEEDIYLMRPMHHHIGSSGFQEAKQTFESGTNEVRRLLLHECNLIYECNVCRNMFRSLANFISHKRVFCRGNSAGDNQDDGGGGKTNGFMTSSNAASSEVLLSAKMESSSHSIKSAALEHEAQQQHNCEASSDVGIPAVAEQVSHCITTMPAIRMKLENVCADESEQLITTIPEEQPKLLNKSGEICAAAADVCDAVVVAQEVPQQIKENNVVEEIRAPEEQPQLIVQHVCYLCNAGFQSEKSLKIHIHKKHLTAANTFQCPSCALTFSQPAAVIKHLANEHKKPVRRMHMTHLLKRRMRHQQREDAKQSLPPQQQSQQPPPPPPPPSQGKGTNRELKRLQSLESNGEKDSGEEQKYSCIYCEKAFERRAAFTTHLSSCHVKYESALDKLDGTASKRIKLQAEERVVIKNEPGLESREKAKMDVDADAELLNEMFANLGKQTFGLGIRTVSLDRLELGGDSTNASSVKETAEEEPKDMSVEVKKELLTEDSTPPVALIATVSKKQRRFRIMNAEKRLSCRCKICNKQFNALSNLRRHISMFHYRARRFGCTLCDYRAFRRYDIVNHLGFVHKMNGEREAMSAEYVSVHEVEYSKDDVDGDIVLVENDEHDAVDGEKASPLRSHEKRAKRQKTSISPADPVDGGENKMTRQRLKRVQQEGSQKSLQKRPIRNRIKPVNKDFVYDLSTLLKSDAQQQQGVPEDISGTENVRALRRRNTQLLLEPLVGPHNRALIKGTAQRLSLQLVHLGRAKSSTQPELPAERPQMRPRLVSSYRADLQHNITIYNSFEVDAARMRSTLLEDTFLEKIAKRSAASFKIKPCLALQHSALSMLLQKVDSSMHASGNAPPPAAAAVAENSAIKKEALNDEINLPEASTASPSYQSAGEYFDDPDPSIPLTSSPPPTPRKRITLMERLAENKAKFRDSLLRSALEN